MIESPRFFVPDSTPEESEKKYAALAEWARSFGARCSVPELADRVYSIEFHASRGETWTATVGEMLQGIGPPKKKRPRRPPKLTDPLPRPTKRRDPAVVLAIFPGDPFVIVTSHGLPKRVGSEWENPFYESKPIKVVRFAHP